MIMMNNVYGLVMVNVPRTEYLPNNVWNSPHTIQFRHLKWGLRLNNHLPQQIGPFRGLLQLLKTDNLTSAQDLNFSLKPSLPTATEWPPLRRDWQTSAVPNLHDLSRLALWQQPFHQVRPFPTKRNFALRCVTTPWKNLVHLERTEPIGQLELLIGDEDKPDCYIFETLYFQAVCVYAMYQ